MEAKDTMPNDFRKKKKSLVGKGNRKFKIPKAEENNPESHWAQRS